MSIDTGQGLFCQSLSFSSATKKTESINASVGDWIYVPNESDVRVVSYISSDKTHVVAVKVRSSLNPIRGEWFLMTELTYAPSVVLTPEFSDLLDNFAA